jgi:hypothetical protein
LQQRDRVLAGLDHGERPVAPQPGDHAVVDALLRQEPGHRFEGRADHDQAGPDHPQHTQRVLTPHGKVGAGGGLVQHREAAAGQPGGLGDPPDLGWVAGEDRDRVTGPEPGLDQAGRRSAGRGVQLTPAA